MEVVQLGKSSSWLYCAYGDVRNMKGMLWNFENLETSGTKLRQLVLYTLSTWIAIHHSLLVSNFADFLTFCLFFFFFSP
jgi:hypothetical protein